jgi:hypothetical protein
VAGEEEGLHRDVAGELVEPILHPTMVLGLEEDDDFAFLPDGFHETKRLELVADAGGVTAHVQRRSLGLSEGQASDDAPADRMREHVEGVQAARQIFDERHDPVEVYAPRPLAALVKLGDAGEHELVERMADLRARETVRRHIRVLREGRIDRVMIVLDQVPAHRVIEEHC